MSELKHILEDFIAHPGWQWLNARVDHDWGKGGTRYESELDREVNTRQDREEKAIRIEQISTARREIGRVMRIPHEELAKLKNLETAKGTSARPPLAPELVGQSRRGGL